LLCCTVALFIIADKIGHFYFAMTLPRIFLDKSNEFMYFLNIMAHAISIDIFQLLEEKLALRQAQGDNCRSW
jgi:hypothetical protein